MKFKTIDSENKVRFYELDNFIDMLNNQFDLMKFEQVDEGYFPISSLHKNDITQAFGDVEELTPEIKKKIKKLSEGNMTWIASKMSDCYCDCCYWSTLRMIIQEYFLK